MQVFLEDITIRLDDGSAFDSTTWHILEGQNWAVLGGTASGKSLLLRAICRKAKLVGGRITYTFDSPGGAEERQYFLNDEVLLFSPESHRNFLHRYATYHQARWQSFEGEDVPSVQEVLDDTARHGDAGESKKEIDPVVDLFDLGAILRRRILHLSHGESRKVLIASLILRGPQLLILDDPFTGLDEESRSALMTGIDALLCKGIPRLIIAVTRVEDLCEGITHLAVVRGNQLVAQGERHSLQNPDIDTARQDLSDSMQAAEETGNPDLEALLEQYAASLYESNMEGMTDLVNIEDASVTYGDASVLRGIHWKVKQGERWALLGPNGAGKTTLLSLIVADNPQAYANRIELFGTRRGSGESIWQIKERIGLVSPELHIFYHRRMTAFEVACSGYYSSRGLYMRCSPEQEALARAWMRALGIADLGGRQFLRLSTGQQRLVILARAMVTFPTLLVLDEPCQALDASTRKRLACFIERLCSCTPVSMIYVTHDRGELPSSITHTLLLKEGEAVFQGPAGSIQADLEGTLI